MAEQEQSKLLPCRLCECAGVVCQSSDGDVEWVKCTRCGYSSGLHYSRDKAIAAWNTPTPDAVNADKAVAVPAIYVSAGQLAAVVDDHDGGTYLPVRRSPIGNFTTPLYATPAPDEALMPEAAVGEKQRAALLGLLAVIHRDGGHKTQEIGWELSAQQAAEIVSKLRTTPTPVEEDQAKYADMPIDQRANAMADDSVGDPWELLGYFREKLRQSEWEADHARSGALDLARKLVAAANAGQVEAAWQALKKLCCADPDNAKRCIMVDRDQFYAALKANGDAS